MLTIEDKNVTELQIVVDTLAGDTDLFVSTTNKTPRMGFSERLSTYPGLYQDVVKYTLGPRQNLTNTYYISVEGSEKSTYQITYFTMTKDGQIGTQKLMVGKKQSGMLVPNLTDIAKTKMAD